MTGTVVQEPLTHLAWIEIMPNPKRTIRPGT